MSRLVVPLALALLSLGCGWKLQARDTSSAGASQTARAPSFSLAGDDGTFVSLDELLAGGHPVVVVFYRGHW